MTRGFAFPAGFAVALAAMIGGAQAKMVRYEINGQTYWYSTNNRQQTEEARQRISAANAAAAAKSKADAELAANPLAGIFGTETQRQAKDAQARFEQAVSRPAASADQSVAPEKSKRVTRAPAKASPERPAPAEARKPPLLAKARSERLARAEAKKPPEPTKRSARVVPAQPAVVPVKRIAEPAEKDGPPKPAVKSVSFDLSSGIKTIEMTDGTVHEEPFDAKALSKLEPAQPAASALTGFVDQVRPSPKN
jgi:hypothetical protein